jgi:polyferredoxin
MEKMDYDKGLIRYTTINEVEGKGLHIFRPRIFVYSAILVGLIIAMMWSLLVRIPVGVDISRDRNILYREATNGNLENVFKIRIMNQDDKAHAFVISLEGFPGAILDLDEKETQVESGEIVDTLVRVQAEEDIIKNRSTNITLRATAVDDEKLTDDEDARFIAPADWFK